MARIEIIRVTCDICGDVLETGMAAGERAFAVDAQPYTIDLCIVHASEFDMSLAPFVQAGRTTATRPARAPARRRAARSAPSGGSPKEIRDWARANGFARVSDRGRVPGSVLAAWQAAHQANGGTEVAAAGSDGAAETTAAPAGGDTAGESPAPAPAARRPRKSAGTRAPRQPRKAAAAKKAASAE